ncbi:hypothetical protein EGW08_019584 [Elysia chlorotica]|uniref:MD-2-related lipid-recognition domain-containing protein n=1 Tax=Elysia chlorotica TaxID=188477 RepID=A0A433STR9_ELYCH|nr:hypothetical protein EGW08_019584 [Elysia chlorotica]
MKTGYFILTAALVLLISASPSILDISDAELLAHTEFSKLARFLGDALQGRVSNTLYFEPSQEQRRRDSVGKFVFNNCADPKNEQVKVNTISLKPDPLKLPGNVTAGGAVTINSPVGSPLKVALDVYYKVFGAWIKVPCVDDIGSCTYDDFCKKINIASCPPEIVKAGLTCKCPFPAGNFSVSSATLPITASLPVSGDVKVEATATMSGKLVTCAQVQLTID